MTPREEGAIAAGQGFRGADERPSPHTLAVRQLQGDRWTVSVTNYLIDVPKGNSRRLDGVRCSGGFVGVDVAQQTLGFVLCGAESRTWYAWDGSTIAELGIPSSAGAAAISPDGRMVVFGRTIAQSYPGAGPGPVRGLRLLTVIDIDGTPRFRVLGANVPGRLSAFQPHWLADSSALVIETTAGLRFVSRAGELLAPAPEGVPSPDDPDLFSFRLWGVTNRDETVQLEVPIGEFRNAIWLGVRPWGDTSELLRFGFAFGGKGFDFPVPLLSAVVQFPPFDEPRLRITGADGCLNLRDDPSFAGAIVACAPNGTTAAITETAPPSRDNPGPAAVFHQAEDEIWIHLELSDGTTGWENANFLEWAP